eukprot:474104-Pyramimonas_sp.AAC.1
MPPDKALAKFSRRKPLAHAGSMIWAPLVWGVFTKAGAHINASLAVAGPALSRRQGDAPGRSLPVIVNAGV